MTQKGEATTTQTSYDLRNQLKEPFASKVDTATITPPLAQEARSPTTGTTKIIIHAAPTSVLKAETTAKASTYEVIEGTSKRYIHLWR